MTLPPTLDRGQRILHGATCSARHRLDVVGMGSPCTSPHRSTISGSRTSCAGP